MKKKLLKIDKTCILIGQLPKCMIISSQIDIFMLISHPIDKIYFYLPTLLMTDITNIHGFFTNDFQNMDSLCK